MHLFEDREKDPAVTGTDDILDKTCTCKQREAQGL